ncbi:aminomethyltransferase beta-barrel domain-containing protein [Candidatus Vidania fulgoroideorum]
MKKIVISLSGGIDSSFTAFILKKLKYNIYCFYLENNIKNEENNCQSEEDIFYCYKITTMLRSKLKVINSSNIFYKKVFLNLIKMYKKGYSYNPDINCNYFIKFDYLIKKIKLKFYKLAFGHYAISDGKNLSLSNDENKDQTYFLYKILKLETFNKFLFPLGKWKKKFVKYVSNFLLFPNINRKSSKGICFINNKNFGNFIKNFIKSKGIIFINEKPTNIIYKNIYYLSLCQRLKKNSLNKKYYVYKKKNKNIYITTKNNLLLKNRIYRLKKFFLKKKYIKVFCKINSCSKFKLCYLIKKKTYLNVIFLYPINKIIRGQHLVFYKKKICIGGGEII